MIGTQFTRAIVAAAFFLVLVGCSSEKRVRVVDGDVAAAIATAAAAIDDGDRGLQFVTAAEVVALYAASKATTPAARESASVAAIDGKTPAAIIAAYDALGEDLQLRYARQALLAKNLKRENDALESAIDSPAFRDNPEYAAAVRAARSKQQREGLGAEWLIDQLSKSPADLVAEFETPGR